MDVEFEVKARVKPRLVLRHKRTIQLLWPLEELSRIEITAEGSDEPRVKFWLRSDLDGKQKPPKDNADPEIIKAFHNGALHRGPKLLFLTAAAARELYTVLHDRKESGDPCMSHLILEKRDGVDESTCDSSDMMPAGTPLAVESGLAAAASLLSMGDAGAQGRSPEPSKHGSSPITHHEPNSIDRVHSVGSVGSVAPRESLIYVSSPKNAKGSDDLPLAKDEALTINNAVSSLIRVGESAEKLQSDLLDGNFRACPCHA